MICRWLFLITAIYMHVNYWHPAKFQKVTGIFHTSFNPGTMSWNKSEQWIAYSPVKLSDLPVIQEQLLFSVLLNQFKPERTREEDPSAPVKCIPQWPTAFEDAHLLTTFVIALVSETPCWFSCYWRRQCMNECKMHYAAKPLGVVNLVF